MSFASDIAAKVKAQQEEQRRKDEAFVERRKLIRALAPSAWQQMRDWFERTVEEFNREVGAPLLTIQPTPSTEIYLHYAPSGVAAADLHLSFRETSSEIAVRNTRKRISETLTFQLNGDTAYLSGFGVGSSIERNCEDLFSSFVQ
ncbi:MAG: hypothetical protein BGO25_05670 [Acidobacteriales bacterium 59-55]|nr:hypothetical protein [Terriglobales bacterium]OJV44571.1 MAG: hypothetical protein BGO25_05670 [Acidobacteriales bacterium 59-55]